MLMLLCNDVNFLLLLFVLAGNADYAEDHSPRDDPITHGDSIPKRKRKRENVLNDARAEHAEEHSPSRNPRKNRGSLLCNDVPLLFIAYLLNFVWQVTQDQQTQRMQTKRCATII